MRGINRFSAPTLTEAESKAVVFEEDETDGVPSELQLSLGSDGKEVWVYFKYERLPWFCFHCGCLGHIAKDCTEVDDDDLLNPLLYQYGGDLRASPMRRPSVARDSIAAPLGVRRKLVFKPVAKEPMVSSGIGDQLRGGDDVDIVDNSIIRSVKGGDSSPTRVQETNRVSGLPFQSPMSQIAARVQGFGISDHTIRREGPLTRTSFDEQIAPRPSSRRVVEGLASPDSHTSLLVSSQVSHAPLLSSPHNSVVGNLDSGDTLGVASGFSTPTFTSEVVSA
ncbi:hypothetical protein Tsubulata_010457 [Turnera subulata]|uniref:CCHC-type domain-containing protein n=1 Tax=Turnera subulata TaxID=218843 RepID=A0A9Q0JJE7_9ROSI|nr:hypothetical protein Tsubulata_010457 [Turnera subulata]